MVHAGQLFESYWLLAKDTMSTWPLACNVAIRTSSNMKSSDLVSQAFPLAKIEQMIREGEIKDGTTVAALGLLRLQGQL